MKKRILTGWTFTRVLYLLMGTALIIQSAFQQQWLGILLGAYVASMGLFALGCASGNCYTQINQKSSVENQNIEFKEVKEK